MSIRFKTMTTIDILVYVQQAKTLSCLSIFFPADLYTGQSKGVFPRGWNPLLLRSILLMNWGIWLDSFFILGFDPFFDMDRSALLSMIICMLISIQIFQQLLFMFLKVVTGTIIYLTVLDLTLGVFP